MGGKPNPGTSKDSRLKANGGGKPTAKPVPPWMKPAAKPTSKGTKKK